MFSLYGFPPTLQRHACRLIGSCLKIVPSIHVPEINTFGIALRCNNVQNCITAAQQHEPSPKAVLNPKANLYYIAAYQFLDVITALVFGFWLSAIFIWQSSQYVCFSKRTSSPADVRQWYLQ